jgi:leucyl aminopeptidase
MQLTWSTSRPAGHHPLVAIAVRDEPDAAALDAAFGKGVREAIGLAKFAGKPGETFSFTTQDADHLVRVVLFGTGDLRDPHHLRVLGHDVVRHANGVGVESLVLDLSMFTANAFDFGGDASAAIRAGDILAQGCELGGYAYEQFIAADKRARRPLRDVVVVAPQAASGEGSERGRIIAASTARARDLVNGPAALVTPSHLAQVATEIVDSLKSDHDVAITVLDRDECARRNMGCYLGVAQGSDEPPKFIHMAYRPRGTTRGRVCLIGKGVTFDSGGYSLKPTEGMLDMKMDMAGAAAVIAAFEAAVKLGVSYEVHSIVAATENMVSGHAYRLGDVLTASNGRTVEINNTDAEGRLTLADALVYASKLEPTAVFDFATLTGACIVALGPRIAGVMSKDDKLTEDWLAAAARSGEPMWRLPLPDDLKEQLKSKVAEMKNTGERYGGAITAGLFLSEFTEGCRWVHVDIAGPAMVSKPFGATTVGGSGFPVATIIELLLGEIRS